MKTLKSRLHSKSALVGFLIAASLCLLSPMAHAQLLYALNAGNYTISSITPTGVVSNIPLIGGNVSFPESLAIDTSGNFYVSYDDNTVRKFDGAGNALAFNLSGGSLDSPAGLAFDASGNLYVANINNNTVSKITPSGVVSTFASGNGLDAPWRLAFDSSGNLYTASLDSGTLITKFDSAGNPLSFPPLSGGGLDSFNPLTGLAFDSQGTLYAVNGNYNTIVTVSDTGAATVFATATDTLSGLAIDASGNFYTAGLNGTGISKFDSAGNAVPFNLSGDSLAFPVDVAFAPPTRVLASTPEPGTLSLTAASLGVLGMAVRGRKKRRSRQA